MMVEEKQKTLEEIQDETYPATEYTKKTFGFSKEQLDELKPLEDATALINVFITVGAIAQKMKDTYVNTQVIPTLGIKNSPDIKLTYYLDKNKITVYEPKYWCSKCDVRKAEYQFEKKAYCKPCIEEKKKEEDKKFQEPIKVEEKKLTKK